MIKKNDLGKCKIRKSNKEHLTLKKWGDTQ